MVPILGRNNRPLPNQYKTTLADKRLAEYDYDLAITVKDENGKELIIPVWRFIEMYLRIKDKSGKFTVFEINEAQIEFYIELCKQKRAGQPMRSNVLKARQLGFSTFIGAVLFVLTIFVPNQTACIIADTAEHATNLFNKYKFYYATLPQFFKNRLPIIASNAKELTVDYGMGQTSKVRVLVQGENAGRSDTCQYLHLSEVAFWQNIEDTTTSILQTVDDSNPNTIIVYETTANGVNYYKEIWDNDVTGTTGYNPCFYPWYLDQNYKKEYWGFELFDWEIKLMEKHNLSLEQIAWYRAQFNKMRHNLLKLRQEFPSAPIEAFIVTGASVFNQELVQEQKQKALTSKPLKQGFFVYKKETSLDGSQIEITDIHWVDSTSGEIKIYEEPIDGHPYIANNDPAMGGEDYYAIQVFNNYTGSQCAVYHKNKCDADEVGFQMYCLVKYYNNALASGETNITSYILKLLKKCGHTFIYRDSDYDNESVRYQDKLGYKTKTTNRQAQIDMFAEAFRDNPNMIKDYATLCEMENFQVIRNETTGNEKVQAIRGKHDDLVMAMCGIFLCRHKQKAIPSSEFRNKRTYTIEEIEYELDRRYEERQRRQERNVYQTWD